MGQLYNRVRETSTTTGTGNLTLAGAVTGFHAFNDKVATGTTVRYVIAHQSANEHEYGIGTFTATSTLARTTVLGGSNGTSAVNLSSGTKDVWVDALAEDWTEVATVPGRISGLSFLGGPYGFGSSGAVVLNTLYSTPFFVGAAQAFNGIVVTALGTASAYCRLGIYADSGGKPGALVVDAGQVDCGSGGEKVASITQNLRGLVWVAAVGQGVAPSLTRLSLQADPQIGTGNTYSSSIPMGYSQTGVSGSLPDPWGATYTLVAAANTLPHIYLRTA